MESLAPSLAGKRRTKIHRMSRRHRLRSRSLAGSRPIVTLGVTYLLTLVHLIFLTAPFRKALGIVTVVISVRTLVAMKTEIPTFHVFSFRPSPNF